MFNPITEFSVIRQNLSKSEMVTKSFVEETWKKKEVFFKETRLTLKTDSELF